MRPVAQIKRRIARHLVSLSRRDAKRSKRERQRVKAKQPHVVHYFHDVGDPYSHLMAQILPVFAARYEVDLDVHLTSAPPDWATPDRARLEAYARTDAEKLARRLELSFRNPGHQPSTTHTEAGQLAFMASLKKGRFLEEASAIGEALWAGTITPDPAIDRSALDATLREGANKRAALGHYLGGTLHYAGEWYWGADRLHYLETRLEGLAAKRSSAPEGLIVPPQDPLLKPVSSKGGKEIDWFVSLRSPYTAITPDRVKALSDHYGAKLNIRYVLPMVMRGMKVPRAKRMYIVTDAMREADRLGVPFGDLVDPLGEPVERGYAILHRAIDLGRGFEFTRSFLRGVWSEGIDAGTDKGLELITERSGLSWAEMKPLIGQDHWRETAERNRAEMTACGVWGVPSFRVGDTVTWGQDRLWLVEEALRA